MDQIFLLLRLDNSLCMYIYHILLIHSFISGHLDYFYLGATVNSPKVYKYLPENLFCSMYLEVELLGDMLIVHKKNFRRDHQIAFCRGHHFGFPSTMHKDCYVYVSYMYSISLPILIIFWVSIKIYSNPSNVCKVVSHNFDLCFPNDK